MDACSKQGCHCEACLLLYITKLIEFGLMGTLAESVLMDLSGDRLIVSQLWGLVMQRECFLLFAASFE